LTVGQSVRFDYDVSGLAVFSFVIEGGSSASFTLVKNGVSSVLVSSFSCATGTCGISPSGVLGLDFYVIASVLSGDTTITSEIQQSTSPGTFIRISGVASAIPIPAALPLFATGLAAVGFAGRRHAKKAKVIAA
jgi:hypothetical protein